MNMKFATVLVALTAALSASHVSASESVKVGYVNTQRIFRDAPAAVKAAKKIETEFSRRDQDLQRMAKQLQGMQETLEKNAVTMTETDRRTKERELNELSREFQRKQREFREDLNQRRNEELASVLDKANRSVKEIAEQENYDIIFQEAVYANPRIDLTDKVIKALSDAK